MRDEGRHREHGAPRLAHAQLRPLRPRRASSSTNRDTYVEALKKSGRSPDEIAGLLSRWGVSRQIYVAETDAKALAEAKDAELWYQESFKKFVVPDRIEDAHPSLQPGFRAMAERLSKITWEGLVAETLAFGSPDTVARHIEEMRQMGVGQVMCWMNFGGLSQRGSAAPWSSSRARSCHASASHTLSPRGEGRTA